MKNEKPSMSAAGVALLRAIESQKPEADRICDDPYAHLMIPGGIGFSLSKLVIESGLYDRMAPGATAFIAVRERFIDDYLINCLKNGLDQVVILGAGYDTRAYRIKGIEKTRVFEIDHPATQAAKLASLQKVFNPLPAHVTFIPVDFNTQSLGDQLASAGYNERGKTLFIWQGVTYFLTAKGVDNTLSFISRHSGKGSAVIFDYFYSEIFNDPSRKDLKVLRRASRVSDEAYMFGIDRDQVGSFLENRGFCDVQNTEVVDLKPLYFTGPNASRRILPSGYAIASAKVK